MTVIFRGGYVPPDYAGTSISGKHTYAVLLATYSRWRGFHVCGPIPNHHHPGDDRNAALSEKAGMHSTV